VKSYNSNGLWFATAGGRGREALELRDERRFRPDEAEAGASACRATWRRWMPSATAVGDDMDLMVDFQPGPHSCRGAAALHLIDDCGVAWIEEPRSSTTIFDGLCPNWPPS